LTPRRTPGRVIIAARLDGDRLELCVSDDGVGLTAESGNSSLGIGIQNVRARLAQLHGSDGTFTLEPAKPHGTIATIRIPYRLCNPGSTSTSIEA
jgi:signal transduction histidine kinase